MPPALSVSLFRGRSCGMTKTRPKLGTPTKYGYRSSKGFVLKGDKVAQQMFWLGATPPLRCKSWLLSRMPQPQRSVTRQVGSSGLTKPSWR